MKQHQSDQVDGKTNVSSSPLTAITEALLTIVLSAEDMTKVKENLAQKAKGMKTRAASQ